MIPVIVICGRSNTGKTTLIEKLLPLFSGRGLSVATIKDYHGEGPVDVPGKDSDRHLKAGACAVVLRGGDTARMFFMVDPSMPLGEFADSRLKGADFVIAEGFKSAETAKIEVALASRSRGLVCAGDPHLVAAVADFDPGAGVPLFGHDEAGRISEFILGLFPGMGGSRAAGRKRRR